MKNLIALAALAAVLAISGFDLAMAKSYGGGGAAKPTAEGTITDVGSRGFTMTVAAPAVKNTNSNEAPAPTEKTVTVSCDNNTKFKNGTEDADGSIVKTGAHVAVMGSISGENQIMATTVSIVSEHKKK